MDKNPEERKEGEMGEKKMERFLFCFDFDFFFLCVVDLLESLVSLTRHQSPSPSLAGGAHPSRWLVGPR